MTIAAERVQAVRAFNRFYTNVIGLLHQGLLRTPYSLTEARVLFELGQNESTQVADLRTALDIDAGYLSRILGRLEEDGLATRERSSVDRRRQSIRLTGRGRKTFRTLDERSASETANLLSTIGEEQQLRVVAAMRAIEEALHGSPPEVPVRLRAPAVGDFGWVIQRHGALYAQEYDWDETFEALVARIVADYIDHHDAEREAAWIAELQGEPVGCVFCVTKNDDTAQLRLLLVEPDARGRSIGTRLVEECIRFARSAGYARMMLWTNNVLEDARRIYERFGFELSEQEKHHSFGHDLVGQNWTLDL